MAAQSGRKSGKQQSIPPSPEVEKAVRKLQADWNKGRRLMEKYPKSGSYGRNVMETIGEKEGVSYDVIQKRRALAASYSESDLAELFELMRCYGAPIGTSFVYRMLSVPRSKRSRFQERAIRQGWSVRQLNEQLRSRFGTRGVGRGRKHRVQGKDEFLAALQSASSSWIRLVDAHRQKNARGRSTMAHLKIGRKLKTRINRAYQEMVELVELLGDQD